MWKRAAFLISLIVLIGLVNSASAVSCGWIGVVDNRWCNPQNWDCGVLPGPNDIAVIGCPSVGDVDIIIDCDVTIAKLKGPGWDGPTCAQSLSFNSGTFYAANFGRNSMDGPETVTYNFNGANVTIGDGDMRVADDGFCVINMTAGSLLVVSGDLRGGDNGGTSFDLNISGGSLTVADGDIAIGDDGNGTMAVSGGNVTCNGGDIVMAARDGGVTTMIVSGTGQVFVGETLRLGKDEPDGDAVLDMEGGTVNVGDLEMHCDGGGDGTQQIIMNDGELTVRGQLSVGCDGPATVQINGGTLSIGSLDIGDHGVIDVNYAPHYLQQAVLIIDGDVLEQVYLYIYAGKIMGLGGSRSVKADYNVTNPGKTTVMYDATLPNLCAAWRPHPVDGQTKVHSSTTSVVLEWIPGDCLGRGGWHNLYFGTDADAVCNGEPGIIVPEFKGSLRLPYYDAGTLPLWTTFYWRVDEINELPTPPTKGDCWTFTTGCEQIPGDDNRDCIVNFEDLAVIAQTWQQQQMWPR